MKLKHLKPGTAFFVADGAYDGGFLRTDNKELYQSSYYEVINMHTGHKFQFNGDMEVNIFTWEIKSE